MSISNIALAQNFSPEESDFGTFDGSEINAQVVREKKSKENKVLIETLINAPIHKVWQSILDYQKFGKSSSIVEVAQVEHQNPLAKVVLEIKLPWPLKTMKCVLQFQSVDNEYTLKWNQVEGCTNKNQGSIVLKEDGNKTYLAFSALVEAKDYIPGRLVSWGLRKGLPAEVERIRQEALATALTEIAGL